MQSHQEQCFDLRARVAQFRCEARHDRETIERLQAELVHARTHVDALAQANLLLRRELESYKTWRALPG